VVEEHAQRCGGRRGGAHRCDAPEQRVAAQGRHLAQGLGRLRAGQLGAEQTPEAPDAAPVAAVTIAIAIAIGTSAAADVTAAAAVAAAAIVAEAACRCDRGERRVDLTCTQPDGVPLAGVVPAHLRRPREDDGRHSQRRECRTRGGGT